MTTENHPDNDFGLDEAAILKEVEFIEAAGVTEPYAFTSSLFTKATFPHSVRGAREGTLVLHNGNMTVMMVSATGDELPYGHVVRLILFWLTREACKRNAEMDIDEARIIPLGGSIQRILREMGIIKPGQRAGKSQYAAFSKQLTRLAHTTITVRHNSRTNTGHGRDTTATLIAEESFFWWEDADVSGNLAKGSYIVLTRKFFESLVNHAVPLSSVHIAKFYNSCLALDLYGWAAHRIYTHSGTTRVTWEQLKGQIGTGYPDSLQGMRDFRRKARGAIARIAEAWPESGISEWPGGVILTGKITPVDPKIVPPHRGPQF
ncbi:replication protein RepA [Corynebacterium senegalense]|uniref:replication protein RepA n=1 Tax=Corynebacterium senegalense TaxID=2080750 RepID=UPI0015F27382|nr:replication protein RepA [Corynebacterium senegalense]